MAFPYAPMAGSGKLGCLKQKNLNPRMCRSDGPIICVVYIWSVP